MKASPLLALCCAALLLAPGRSGADEITWTDALALRVEGRGWSDLKSPYDRLPARAEGVVRPEVWNLSRHATGLNVGFVTDATAISVRWTLTSSRIAMNHMPATGVSGVDLYVRRDGRWHFLAVGRLEEKVENELRIVQGLPAGEAEYRLNLPLYNGVKKVEIGVPSRASIRPSAGPAPGVKPIVIYGTSITQGGCASRPGMAYPAILARRLDRPVINLGFSGNGKAEPELAQLVAELDPAVFVLDCLPNLSVEQVGERVPGFIQALRDKHPETPILLVENIVYTDADSVASRAEKVRGANASLGKIYRDRVAQGDRRISLLPAADLIGGDGEGTVDGTHPTDLGFARMADAFEPALRKILATPAP
ncbi:SGNH/GDSL hydrolase family protein [Tundrisphaera sp. TA3]|uniref:SGNH/GDSL hydrolase family protein n=1 Tax=Tundrisphaera sp. TA3 TaxID=3435775 RepID=UPI003EBC630E